MSADNRIIYHPIWTGQWAVWMGSGSMEYHEAPPHAALYNTEDEAREAAFEWEAKCDIVEYGVQTLTREEQETALAFALKDLAERLVRLRETGSQWKSQTEDRDE